MEQMMNPVIVSGADAKYYDLVMGAVVSSLRVREEPEQVVVLDLGLTDMQRSHIRSLGAGIVNPNDFPAIREMIKGVRIAEAALLVRPFLPQLLPGCSPIMWLDSDAWIQRRWALEGYMQGALHADVVVTKERHPSYLARPRLHLWEWKHLMKSCGVMQGTSLAMKPHVNAGVFAARSDSPLWPIWQRSLLEIYERLGTAAPYDQMALNYCVYGTDLTSVVLDARYNWICKRRVPNWDAEHQALSVPEAGPAQAIGIIHLAGVGKDDELSLPRVDGGIERLTLRYRAI
jgi:hypothetical protein